MMTGSDKRATKTTKIREKKGERLGREPTWDGKHLHAWRAVGGGF